MSVLVYVRMNVMGEFKISYSKLGPTEVRVLAIMLTIAMFFGGCKGIPPYSWFNCPCYLNPYDLVVTVITLLLVFFFAQTSIKQAIIELRNLGE